MTRLIPYLLCALAAALSAQTPQRPRAPGSSPDDPQPRVVTPGKPGQPPSDAIVLFDGADLSKWTSRDGAPLRWVAKDGVILSTSVHKESGKTQDLVTKDKFGAAQIHVEFSIPAMPNMKDQAKGNSGVYRKAATRSRFWTPTGTPPTRTGAPGRCTDGSRRW